MRKEIEEEDARQKAEKAAREKDKQEQIRVLLEEQQRAKEQAEAVCCVGFGFPQLSSSSSLVLVSDSCDVV